MPELFYGLLEKVGFLHPIHPVVLTMLIGPVMGAVFFQVLGLVFKAPALLKTARHMTVMGFIFLFPTILVGVIDWYYFYGASPEMFTIWMKSLGAGLLFVSLLSTLLLFKKLPERSVVILGFYLASAGLVSMIGTFGGDIVFSKEKPAETGVAQAQLAPDGSKTVQHEQFTVSWKIEGQNISFRISNPTPGWVGLGFGKTGLMKGSHIVLGYVDEQGKAVVEDHYGNANSKHSPKQGLGRPDTLLERGASLVDGVTTIWFTLPLKTSDPEDPVLVSGETVSLILARATKAKDTKTYHGNADSGGRYTIKVVL